MEISQAFSPLRAIGHGVAAARRAPLSVLVGGFLMVAVTICSGGGGGGGGNIDESMQDVSPEVALAIALAFLGFALLGMLVGFVFFLVRCWLLPGWIRLQKHVVEHGTEDLPRLFSGGDAFVRMVLWRLLQGFIRFGTTLVALLPGLALIVVGAMRDGDMALVLAGVVLACLLVAPVAIYIGLGLSLGDLAVTLEDLGPLEALDRSWELARGNRFALFVYFLVVDYLFVPLGLLLCGIGVIGTRAVADVGTTEAFLLATDPNARDFALPREEGLD